MARLFDGAFSVASSAAPLHSPPRARPWQKRRTTRSAGARKVQPGTLAVGRQPIRKVALLMVSREATRVRLPPNLAPEGRNVARAGGPAIHGRPNTGKDGSSWGLSFCPGKKSF